MKKAELVAELTRAVVGAKFLLEGTERDLRIAQSMPGKRFNNMSVSDWEAAVKRHKNDVRTLEDQLRQAKNSP